MNKAIILMTVSVMMLSSTVAFGALTEAQKAEQRKQQAAAQRAYEASASTYDEVAREATQAKKVAENVRDGAVYTYVGGATGGYGGAAAGAALKGYDVATSEN